VNQVSRSRVDEYNDLVACSGHLFCLFVLYHNSNKSCWFLRDLGDDGGASSLETLILRDCIDLRAVSTQKKRSMPNHKET
jgi:hypothetical protein